MQTERLVSQLRDQHTLDDDSLLHLIELDDASAPLAAAADEVRREVYGTEVYTRGLIEMSNWCRNNCYYCGIRAGNPNVERYRLSKEDILECARSGHTLGYRTFVLQGGEDPALTDEFLVDVVQSLHEAHPDCAITLSVGERSA